MWTYELTIILLASVIYSLQSEASHILHTDMQYIHDRRTIKYTQEQCAQKWLIKCLQKLAKYHSFRYSKCCVFILHGYRKQEILIWLFLYLVITVEQIVSREDQTKDTAFKKTDISKDETKKKRFQGTIGKVLLG